MEEALDVHECTAAEWSAYCRAKSDAKIRQAARDYLTVEVPETAELSMESRDALVNMLLSFDTEGYFYLESTHE